MSKFNPLNLKDLKNSIDEYSTNKLNNLLSPPKAFTSELIRFFVEQREAQNEQEDYEYIKSSVGGDVITANQSANNIEAFKTDTTLGPVGKKGKTPIIELIEDKYILCASREEFQIYGYNVNKSCDIRNRNDQDKTKPEMKKSSELLHVYTRIDSKSLSINKTNLYIHSACYMRIKSGKSILIFGNNNGILKFYNVEFDNDNYIIDMIELPHLNVLEKESLPKQKIQSIVQFKNSDFIIGGMSFGWIFVVNTTEMTVVKTVKVHKGNITSLGFAQDSTKLISGSGSFCRNHDNSIKAYHIIFAYGNIFFKEDHCFDHAHGKIKGVMAAKANNLNFNDTYIFSCGNEDDNCIAIWCIHQKVKLHEIPGTEQFCYYNLSIIKLLNNSFNKLVDNEIKEKNIIDPEVNNKNNIDNKSQETIYKDSGFIICAAGISFIEIMLFDSETNKLLYNKRFLVDYDIGSYLSCLKLMRQNDEEFFFLVGNTSSNFYIYRIRQQNQ